MLEDTARMIGDALSWRHTPKGRVALYVGLGLLVMLYISAHAKGASAVQDSCALARQPDVASPEPNWRQWVVWTGTAAPCSIGSGSIDQIQSGNSIAVGCQGGTVGPVAPLGADTITIRMVSDATDFPSATPTAIRSYTLTAGEVASCNSGPTGTLFTFHCTDDGQAGGSPRHGIVRIHIRAQRTTVPTYDVNSETTTHGLYGVIRCTASLDTLSESAPPAGSSQYKGGDLIGLQHSAGSTAYRATNDIALRITCGAARNDLGADRLETTVTGLSQTLKGPRTAWPQACDLRGWLDPQQSVLAGFATYNYTRFHSTPAGTSAAAYGGGVVLDIPKTVDRLLDPTPGGRCDTPFHKPGLIDVTKRNLGQTLLWECQWQHSATLGTTTPPNNRLFTAYVCLAACTITSPSYGADVGTSFNGTFGSQGFHDSAHTIKTTFVHTQPPEQAVHTNIETYGASRTPAELYNFGGIPTNGSPDRLVVSERLAFTSLLNSKTSGGPNATTFIIGADEQYLRPLGLTDATGDAYAGAPVTCDRIRPDTMLQDVSDHGVTDASGDADEASMVPQAPSGVWRFVCTAMLDGNNGTAQITFVYESAFTGDIRVDIATRAEDADNTNVSIVIRQYDPVTDDIVPVLADEVATVFVKHEGPTEPVFTPTNGGFETTQVCAICSLYYVVIPNSVLDNSPNRTIIYAHVNITQSPFVGMIQYEAGVAPVVAKAMPYLLTAATVLLALGTARLPALGVLAGFLGAGSAFAIRADHVLPDPVRQTLPVLNLAIGLLGVFAAVQRSRGRL